jgi:hypothetical protein
MSGSIRKRGRPKTTGSGEGVHLRLLPELLAPLDAWIAAQAEPRPTRPEAIRRLLTGALGRPAAGASNE